MKKSSIDFSKKAIILQKPSGTIAIGGNLDARERKFYNVFLKVAEDILKQNPQQYIFSVTLVELKQALDAKGKDKHNSDIKRIIKRMHKIDVEYNVLKKDKNIEGYASLLDNIEFVDYRESGGRVIVKYSIPEIVRLSMVQKNGIYASINLVVVKGLKSKYSIILYELIKDYEKVEIPEMTMKEFRKIFGVEKKYKIMTDLRKRVLDPAVNEINNSENVDFLVSYELKKEGKAYTSIKFYVRPKPKVLKLKQQAIKVIEQNVKENPDLQELLALIPSEYRRIAKLITAVESALKEKGKEYVKAQIEYTLNRYEKGKVKDFVVYLKKAIKEDYANFEKVDDIGFITVDDAIGFRGYATKDGKEYYVEIAVVEPKENNSDKLIGRDKERKYLVRLDEVETGELFDWYEMSEKRLLEYAKRNVERRKRIREK